jgi:hypothetical protein
MNITNNNQTMLEEMATKMSYDVYPILLQKMYDAGIKTISITSDALIDFGVSVNVSDKVVIRIHQLEETGTAYAHDSEIIQHIAGQVAHQREMHHTMRRHRMGNEPVPDEDTIVRQLGTNGIERIGEGLNCPIFHKFSSVRCERMRVFPVNYFSYCKAVFDIIDAISEEAETRKNIFKIFDRIPVTRKVIVEKMKTKYEKSV